MRLSNRTLVAAAAVVLGVTGLVLPASSAGAASSPIQLLVPQGTAFSVLGYDCGGIGENAYATGFDSTIDPLAGYPTGDVFLTTTCSAGKGTHFTVTAWTSDTWDLTGALLSYSVLSGAPTVNPNFSTTDPPTGNQVYNTTNFHCTTQTWTVPDACLQLASSFTPRPRVTGISATQGPATGGTSVTISGDGFTAATNVYFGSIPAAGYTINSDTSITAVAPGRPLGHQSRQPGRNRRFGGWCRLHHRRRPVHVLQPAHCYRGEPQPGTDGRWLLRNGHRNEFRRNDRRQRRRHADRVPGHQQHRPQRVHRAR